MVAQHHSCFWKGTNIGKNLKAAKKLSEIRCFQALRSPPRSCSAEAWKAEFSRGSCSKAGGLVLPSRDTALPGAREGALGKRLAPEHSQLHTEQNPNSGWRHACVQLFATARAGSKTTAG